MILKKIIIPLSILFFCNTSFSKENGKIEFMAGAYTLSFKAETRSGSFSNVGSYSSTFHYNFIPGIDFSVGYSLFFSNIISGDIGYGPDLGFTFYPFSMTKSLLIQTDNVYIYTSDLWRPYANLSFHQRQFQSISSSYAGFGINLGTEYQLNPKYALKFSYRMQSLNGPQSSTSNFTDFLMGISFGI